MNKIFSNSVPHLVQSAQHRDLQLEGESAVCGKILQRLECYSICNTCTCNMLYSNMVICASC